MKLKTIIIVTSLTTVDQYFSTETYECVFPAKTIIDDNTEKFTLKVGNKYVVHSTSYNF